MTELLHSLHFTLLATLPNPIPNAYWKKMKLNKYEMFFFLFFNYFMYFKKNLRILVNGQAMATWPDALKIAKMAKNSHLWLWTHCATAVSAISSIDGFPIIDR
jgi:hypothetical protein